jgi:flavin-binding protein dodecin
MSIVRSIEVIAQSPISFDDACREAIKEAAKTLRGINSFWIKKGLDAQFVQNRTLRRKSC